MYVCGLVHAELGEHCFSLTGFPVMCEGRSSLYGRWTSQDHGKSGETGETCGEVELPCSNHGGFWFFINGSSKMDEIHIMGDMFMDDAAITMLVTTSK